MSTPTVQVLIFFGTPTTGSGVFVLDSSLLGTGVLGGDSGTDVTAYTQLLNFTRGKTSQIFDQIDAAQGVVQLNNRSRLFDPKYTAGSLYGTIKPGLRIRVLANGVVIFDGFVQDWDYSYEVSGQSLAFAKLEDALALLGRRQFLDWTTTAGQAAGARLTDVLNRSEVAWSGGARALDAGVSTLQADSVTWGSNVLNYCQLVSQSDLGAFFASRDGLVTFRDRHATLGGGATVAFADDGTGIPFQEIGQSFGAETFFNRVSVDRLGGTAQTYTTGDATTGGIRSQALSGLLMDSDGQALDMATYIATTYTTGEQRISSVKVYLDTNAGLTVAQINQVLALDIDSLVAVKFTPNRIGSPISQTCVVQGVEHDVTPETHAVTLHLGKWDSRSPFILDSSTLGVLDTGPGVLSF